MHHLGKVRSSGGLPEAATGEATTEASVRDGLRAQAQAGGWKSLYPSVVCSPVAVIPLRTGLVNKACYATLPNETSESSEGNS